MIISRAPFRISLFGGGTDLPAFYEKNGRGAVLSFSINKYMYIIVHRYFHDKIRLKYSKTEDVERAEQLDHPLARECLKKYRINKGLEIASIADIPSGSGLGSSSAFTVAMLKALSENAGEKKDNERIAFEAAQVEINVLKQPIGKQDQYGSALGGLKFIEFLKDGSVNVEKISYGLALNIIENVLLFYVGTQRSASNILQLQSDNMGRAKEFDSAQKILELSDQAYKFFKSGSLDGVGELLQESWSYKKQLSPHISTPFIDEIYDRGMKNGASGAKLLGAGGGGFILFFSPPHNHDKLRKSMSDLKELRVELDMNGASIIHRD